MSAHADERFPDSAVQNALGAFLQLANLRLLLIQAGAKRLIADALLADLFPQRIDCAGKLLNLRFFWDNLLFYGYNVKAWAMRVVGLFMGDANVLKAKVRERIQQIRAADPVAELCAAAAESGNSQTMHIFLAMQRIVKAFCNGGGVDLIPVF